MAPDQTMRCTGGTTPITDLRHPIFFQTITMRKQTPGCSVGQSPISRKPFCQGNTQIGPTRNSQVPM